MENKSYPLYSRGLSVFDVILHVVAGNKPIAS
jgi:hypothetical protein